MEEEEVRGQRGSHQRSPSRGILCVTKQNQGTRVFNSHNWRHINSPWVVPSFFFLRSMSGKSIPRSFSQQFVHSVHVPGSRRWTSRLSPGSAYPDSAVISIPAHGALIGSLRAKVHGPASATPPHSLAEGLERILFRASRFLQTCLTNLLDFPSSLPFPMVLLSTGRG